MGMALYKARRLASDRRGNHVFRTHSGSRSGLTEMVPARSSPSLRRNETVSDELPRVQACPSRISPQTLWPILADTFRFKIVPSLHLSPLASAGPFASITYRARIFRLYRTLRTAAASLWPFSVVCLTCAIAGCAANETTTRLDLRTDDPMRPSEETATYPIVAMVGARTVRCAVQSYSRSE